MEQEAKKDDQREQVRRDAPRVFESIIKVEVSDPPKRRRRDIEDGIGYACALLMDEYGASAEQVQDVLERATDEAWDREVTHD